jgi:ribonuclease R
MSKKKRHSPGKLKKSLSHIIRKVFENNPDSILSHKQICALIDVRESALRKLVFEVLEDDVFNGFLQRHAHSTFGLSSTGKGIEGTLELTNRGAGYVVTDDEQSDVYIAPKNLSQGLHGDRVRVRIIRKGNTRLEGRITEVLSRARTEYIGTIEMHANFAFLVSDNLRTGTDIYISKELLNGAKHGDKCLARLKAWPSSSKNPYGEIINILGKTGSIEVEMVSILCNHGIPHVFPEEVTKHAAQIPVVIDEQTISKRMDLRHVLTFTIDPVDAKDFDDALSIQILPNGHYEIGVHIADVSHYVQEGDVLDQEAYKRGNSVYLTDRVIHMLPEELSNVICSLRPNEDKLTFSVLFEIDDQGNIHKHLFSKTIIHSKRRYTYEEVQEILEKEDDPHRKELVILDKIAKILRKNRMKAGALDIGSEEMRFQLNEIGKPIGVVWKTSKDAHKLIEEFMLLANKYVALFGGKTIDNKPFLYRIHDQPDMAKMEMFNVFIAKFGHKIPLDSPKKIGLEINRLLHDISGEAEHSLVQSMAIRSMAKAVYDTDNIGHYGLSFPFYTHFTSPIRRYADLIVHRILNHLLEKNETPFGMGLKEICKHISGMERKAVEAERESNKFFQTLYVEDKKGQVFTGNISGLAEFGIFVRMHDNHCEGMISMNSLKGDRYYFDNDKFVVMGMRSNRTFHFGDQVTVKITEVHPRKRQIDLELVG